MDMGFLRAALDCTREQASSEAQSCQPVPDDRKADHADEGLRRHGPLLYPVVRTDHCRTSQEMKMPIRDLPLRVGVSGPSHGRRLCAMKSIKQGHLCQIHQRTHRIWRPRNGDDCDERNGLHINEDHLLVETIDPVTLQPVPSGQRGRWS